MTYDGGHSGPIGSGIIYEIQQGLGDRGASLRWLSQYPHEAEVCFPVPSLYLPCTFPVPSQVCFPPLLGLEVQKRADGTPAKRTEGAVVVVELRPSVSGHMGEEEEGETLRADLTSWVGKLPLLTWYTARQQRKGCCAGSCCGRRATSLHFRLTARSVFLIVLVQTTSVATSCKPHLSPTIRNQHL